MDKDSWRILEVTEYHFNQEKIRGHWKDLNLFDSSIVVQNRCGGIEDFGGDFSSDRRGGYVSRYLLF